MKKVTILVICLLVLSSVCISEEEMNFRNVKWGMSEKEVKKRESAKYLRKMFNHLLYDTRLNGLDCTLAYGFYKDQLFTANYLFKETYSNYNKYVEDFMNLKELLDSKYGEFKTEVVIGDHKGMDLGIAVGMGLVKLCAAWETKDTQILLQLFGNNFNFSLYLTYINPELNEQYKNSNKEKVLDNI